MRRFALLIASTLVISSCSPLGAGAPGTGQAPPTWPPATGTVLAQTDYGRITSVESGGSSIELRETPLPRERSETQRAEAIATIRLFAQTPDLPLTYLGLQRHPENTGIVVEVYASVGTEFMVDVQTNAVVYMQASAVPTASGTDTRLSPTQLEEQVRTFLSKENLCFEDVVGQLQFEPGNKGDNYFFRWRSPHPNADRPWNQPTFVQIGIDIYGTIFGYIDSGICHLAAE